MSDTFNQAQICNSVGNCGFKSGTETTAVTNAYVYFAE